MMKFFPFAILIFISANLQAQFAAPKTISLSTDPANHEQYIRTTDIDGDGKIDILVGGRGSNNIRYYRNLGNLEFDSTVFLPVTFLDLKDIETADLNNDGKQDLVSLDVQAKKLFWHPNANGLFPQQNLILDNLEVEFGRILCNDFNGDGNIDIVIATFSNALLFINDGAGNFSVPQKVMLEADEEEIYDNVFGDYNNDGFIDLALAGNGFLIYLNDGTGNFTKDPFLNMGISFLLESADYNNDGLDDVLMAAATLVHYQNSPSGFSFGPVFTPNTQNFQTMFSVDLDNDGDIDILTEENQTNKFIWYENINAGTSWIQHIITTVVAMQEGTIYGVRAADLDGDGDKDLIRTTSKGNVVIYENQKIGLDVKNATKSNFNIFPNPASDYLNIYGIESNDINIQIYDLLGKIIYTENRITSNSKIDISSLKNGNYLLKIVSDNGLEVKKISIVH